jgi:RNA polymerase sigma-70 factor (ECF subfamily)
MSDLHLLVEEQLPRLMRYAAALTRDGEQAGVLVEEAVIEAIGKSHLWVRGADDLRIGLLTILHELRGNPFRQADPAATANDNLVRPETLLTLSDLDRAMALLPEEQRAAILLVGLEGLSYRETAAILGISQSTMRARLTRGRDSLRRAMGVADEARQLHAA